MAELLLKDPREYLTFEHELRKARRPSYSMRAFARDLEVSPSSLNDFLKGRVGMSADRVERIAAVLRWTEKRKDHFQDLITAKYEKDVGAKLAAQTRIRSRLKDGTFGLSAEAFRAISEWHHLVILEICDCKDGMDAATIAKELSLPLTTMQKSVKRLIGLGLLEKTDDGLKPLESASHFGDEAPSDAIVSFHCQVMQLAQKALQEKSSAEREALSVMFTLNSDDLEKMNAEIKKSVMSIINRYAQTTTKNHIHTVALQSFPIWTDAKDKK